MNWRLTEYWKPESRETDIRTSIMIMMHGRDGQAANPQPARRCPASKHLAIG
jgi:hypothetical protein